MSEAFAGSESEGVSAPLPTVIASESQGRVWVNGVLSLGIVLAYIAFYVSYIHQHTALPYADEAGYVMKTYQISDQGIHFWNLSRLIAVQPSVRPPLFPAIAAAILGSRASEQQIAIAWLVIRMLALVAGAGIISRLFRRSAIMPALLLIVLGTPFFMTFRGLYMMDQPFTCFALLAFAAFLYDDLHPSWRSSLAVAASVILLFLIKPAAPVLVMPLCVVRALRAAWQWRSKRPPWREIVLWAAGYAVLGAIMLILIASPYGQASRDQYRLGSLGYWAIDLAWNRTLRLSTAMMPVVCIVGVLLFIVSPRRAHHKWIILYVVVTIAWWACFNFILSYTTDERITVNVMPMFAAGVLVLLASRPRALLALSCIAAAVFSWNLLIVNGNVAPLALGTWDERFPVQATYCEPAVDPGARRLAQKLNGLLPDNPPSPEACVNVVFTDHFFNALSVSLAVRELAFDHGRITPHQVLNYPVGEKPFSFETFLRSRWFVTEAINKTYDGSREAMFVDALAADQLLTDMQSPIRGALEIAETFPIKRPSRHGSDGILYSPIMDDAVTLWRLKRELTPAEKVASLEFVLPLFTNPATTRGQMEALIREQKSRATLASS